MIPFVISWVLMYAIIDRDSLSASAQDREATTDTHQAGVCPPSPTGPPMDAA